MSDDITASNQTPQQVLLSWYRQQGRDLPWRKTRDPYAILVSEMMLQQTQVDRVLPKFALFMAMYPTLESLANAPTDAVIRLWAGLGYNQRAVRLQQIARAVMERYAGVMPTTIDELLQLPGIGRYTAGAIACFAHGQAVATVDTNIRRVLTRIFIGDLSPEAQTTTNAATALSLAESVLPPDPTDAYDWNQALMDLGATICLARQPYCERCPLTNTCRTYQQMLTYTLFPTGAALKQLQEQLIAESPATYTVPKRPIKQAVPFKTSTRFYRGRIIEHLRGLSDGQNQLLAELGPEIKDGYMADDEPWLRMLVASLVRDGLTRWDDEGQTRVSLPR